MPTRRIILSRRAGVAALTCMYTGGVSGQRSADDARDEEYQMSRHAYDVPRFCPSGKRMSWRVVDFSGVPGPQDDPLMWCCPDFAPGLYAHTNMDYDEVGKYAPNAEVAALYGAAVAAL